MAKLCQETNLPWPDILPLVLWICFTPQTKIGFSPFEILYRRPHLLVKFRGDLTELGNLEIQKQLKGLGKTIFEIHRWVTDRITHFPRSNWAPSQTWGSGLDKRLEKETSQTYLEGTLFSCANRAHSHQGCRTDCLDPPFLSKGSPSVTWQPLWTLTRTILYRSFLRRQQIINSQQPTPENFL